MKPCLLAVVPFAALSCAFTADAATTTYEALLPSRVYAEVSENPVDIADRYASDEPYALTAGLEWDLSPAPVRIIDSPDAHPWDARKWDWLQAPAPEAHDSPPEGLLVTHDPKSGLSISLPTAAIVAILAALGVGGGAYVQRRRKATLSKD